MAAPQVLKHCVFRKPSHYDSENVSLKLNMTHMTQRRQLNVMLLTRAGTYRKCTWTCTQSLTCMRLINSNLTSDCYSTVV